MQIIDTQNKLDEALRDIKSNKIIGVDTEFVRTNSFWPKLCTIQISTKSNFYLIDALSNLNNERLWEAFTNKDITKIIHSSRQDIEAIFYISQKVPYPIFDTQLAAMFTGFREAISYSQIVDEIFQIKIDKKLQYSDWSKRPISKEMLDYAKDDVKYLIPIFQYLSKQIESQSKAEWFLEEVENVHNKSIELSKKMIQPIDNIGKKISTDRDPLSCAKELRDEIAICYNIPRKDVLSDTKLNEIFKSKMDNIEDLRIFLNDNQVFTNSPHLLSMLHEFLFEISKNKRIKFSKKILSKNQKIILKLLNDALENNAKKYNICPHIIATQREIRDFITRGNKFPKFTNGWRNSVFGKDAEAILNSN